MKIVLVTKPGIGGYPCWVQLVQPVVVRDDGRLLLGVIETSQASHEHGDETTKQRGNGVKRQCSTRNQFNGQQSKSIVNSYPNWSTDMNEGSLGAANSSKVVAAADARTPTAVAPNGCSISVETAPTQMAPDKREPWRQEYVGKGVSLYDII